MNNYVDAIRPKIYTICGMEMKPFSLGHYLLLEQIDSPFLTDDENATIDLVSGIYSFYFTLLICAQSYEDNIIMLNDEKIVKKLCKQFSKNLKKTMKIDKQWNIFACINMFKEYVQYFTQMPIFQVERESKSLPSGIDWKQNLFTIAKNEWHYSDSEVLNMPLKRLFYEWCSYAEKNGAIRVQNIDEITMLQEYKKRQQTSTV